MAALPVFVPPVAATAQRDFSHRLRSLGFQNTRRHCCNRQQQCQAENSPFEKIIWHLHSLSSCAEFFGQSTQLIVSAIHSGVDIPGQPPHRSSGSLPYLITPMWLLVSLSTSGSGST